MITRHALGYAILVEYVFLENTCIYRDIFVTKLLIKVRSIGGGQLNANRVCTVTHNGTYRNVTFRERVIREEVSIREKHDHGERPKGSNLASTLRARVYARYWIETRITSSQSVRTNLLANYPCLTTLPLWTFTQHRVRHDLLRISIYLFCVSRGTSSTRFFSIYVKLR